MDNKVLDEAVEVALSAMFKVEFDKWPDNMRQDMRAALLAALPVLLGPVVEELQRESDVCSEIGDMISAGKAVTYWACAERIEALYAPDLGGGK